MITTDETINEFIRLLESAILITQKIRDEKLQSGSSSWAVESADLTITNLNRFRQAALSGTLPRPSKGDVPQGTGLGLLKAVGEWNDSKLLLDAISAVEECFRKSL